MKKLIISLFSFILILTGGIVSTKSFSTYADEQTETTVTEVKVYNKDELVAELSKEANYNNSLVKIVLQDNIDLKDVDLSPISDLSGNFTGTFDGNGYALSNLKFTSTTQYFGLIPYATDATIQNLKITGDVKYEFNTAPANEIFAGVLVGRGKNVVFSNCEFDGNGTITLPIYSDFYFGLLAGELQGNPLANSSDNQANIKDCVNYYNINVELNKQSNAYVGGFVGLMKNSFVLNVLNFGNISLTNNLTDGGNSESLSNEYLGGIIGGFGGSGTQVRNAVFAGTMTADDEVSLHLYKGAILGGAVSSGTSTANINFNYYTDGNIRVSGDNFVSSGDKMKLVDVINKTFLTETTNFDEQSQPFDFNAVWSLTESKYHLQNFMTFSFTFKSVLHQTIESAKFYVEEDEYANTYTARYGAPVRIDVMFKPEYIGYYQLSGLSLSNIEFDMNKATVESITNEKSQTTGYTIIVSANATTSGSYSFNIQSITYNCIATISDEAKIVGQGGVRIADNNLTTPTDEMTMQFTYNSAVKKITAEGTSGSVYAFDCWKLYYKTDSGDFSAIETPFANATDSTLSISFGTAPFDREFKLVAYFTDEDAILISFGDVNSKYIKSIKFGGVDYDGTPIAVSPNHAKNLEIVTAENYKLNVKAFTDAIQTLYGENSIETLVVSEPEESQNGETTYKFSINMRSIQGLEDNNLSITLEVVEDDSNKNDNMLWLYIALPVAGVLIIGIIVIVLVKRSRGGGGGKGGKAGSSTAKPKKTSYKDFY